ncbi:BTAD domain-containing putative transcriptional regulator [Streptomyces sp. NPDC057638]|uniref:BTAD domain-containing putative transcriptional regulator n=1 Tax=Streptomyces sp. NPDC057638 TaxID=3346190 RepID=UPI003675F2CC
MFGEMDVRVAGRALDVGTPRQQTVLAALVVDARRPVPIELLTDRVWGSAPPADPRAVLYSHLSRIRRLLERAAELDGGPAVRLERRHAGYLLDIDPGLVDLHRFRRLAAEGADPRRDDGARSATLATALRLWRGVPLAGLPGDWAAQVRESWQRRRLDAVEQWARIELRLGHPGAVIAALPDLATEYPLVEPFEALLIQALRTAGRSAEALDRYTLVRQRLADELGADPGPELQAQYLSVLRGEPPPPPGNSHASAASVRAPVADPPEPGPGAGEPLPAEPLPAEPLAMEPLPAEPLASEPLPAEPLASEPPPTQPLAVEPLVAPAPRSSRRTVLTALAVVVLPVTFGVVYAAQGDERGERPPDPPPAPPPPPVERARALFAEARRLQRAGRTAEARKALVGAVRRYGKLLAGNPERDGPVIAPSVVQALGMIGVDFSVPEAALRGWLANPLHSAYPWLSQTLLLQGWRFTAPVYLDVITWNYEHTPGARSPRGLAAVRLDILRAAVLEGSNSRHGTSVTEFRQLLGA